MDEDNFDCEDDSIVVSYRSPTFSQAEITALLDLVVKHKNIILNKSTNYSANHAKDVAWVKICKELNTKRLGHTRTAETLKTKWENLKKVARKFSKNLIDGKCSDSNEVLTKMLELMNEADTISSKTDSHDETPGVVNDTADENVVNLIELWSSNVHKESDDSNDTDYKGRFRSTNRSLNFSPQECSLLLKCVKDEKDIILSKETTNQALQNKSRAWSRIVYNFNKQSPQKRNVKVLRTKFDNMKKLTRSVRFKDYFSKKTHELLEEVTEKSMDKEKEVKSEPEFEYKPDSDIDNDSEDNDDLLDITDKQSEDTSDPLSTVLNGDSGLDSLSNFGCSSQFDNKEVVKMKLELLKYQMQTEKLKRTRIMEALEVEAAERRSRAIETSLRLRTARLNAVAAESNLPRKHPALKYHAQEKEALQYMKAFQKLGESRKNI